MVIAVTATAIGFAYDAGSGGKELSAAFSTMYVLGCLFAVLAVRQAGIFTAVIQPPLILFFAVPTAYFLFHSGDIGGLKDVLINCGYPLIERFPLMFFTSAVVLLIGMARWYFGAASPRAARAKADEPADTTEPPRRRHSIERSARTTRSGKTVRSDRPVKRTATTRSRHARPPDTEIIEPVVERPRRRAPRQSVPPPAEPRRRARANPPYERPDRRPRYDDYPAEPHHGNGSNTHHPVSRVRYRGADDADRWQYDV